MAVSTFAIISVAGMFIGVAANFSPFLSRMVSASLFSGRQVNEPVCLVKVGCRG